MKPAALGFAPHSGWAAAIALGGPGPALLYRGRVAMADPALPGAPQPYHALEGLPLAEAERGLARYQASAARLARAGLRAVLAALEKQGYAARAVGILASSGRRGGSLAAILAAHPLIHTADGEHFRDALTSAASACALPVLRVPLKELSARAAAAIGRPEAALQETLKAMGRAAGPPWTADQKTAALLAWMLLDRSPGGLGA